MSEQKSTSPKKLVTSTSKSHSISLSPSPSPTSSSTRRHSTSTTSSSVATTNMDQAVAMKERVLACSYKEFIQREREGKVEANVARIYNLVRERHSDIPASKLSDSILKVAKDSLRDKGDIVHERGAWMSLSQKARDGIESWKENEDPETEDDQDAVSRYLKDGVNPKAVKSKAKSKSKRASDASSHKSATESASKGKKRQQESEDEDAEDGSDHEGGSNEGKGKGKRVAKGKGGRPSKKPKVVVAPAQGKPGGDDQDDEEESEEEPLAKKKKSGRKSQSDSALKKLKKDALIEKIKELQAQVKGGDVQEMDLDLEEDEDNKPLGLGGGKGKVTKKVVVRSPAKEERKGKGRASMVVEGEGDSDGEGEKEEEESQVNPLSRRSKSPSHLSELSLLSQLSSTHSDTAATSQEQQQQQSYSPRALPPLPSQHQKVSTSAPIPLGVAQPVQGRQSHSNGSEVTRLRQEVSLNLDRKKALQEELDLVSHAYQDLLLKESNAILAQSRSDSDDNSEDPLVKPARPAPGDVTLVDELEEDEHPSMTRLSQVDRMFEEKEKSTAKTAAATHRPQSQIVDNQILVKQAAEIEDLRQKLERAAEQADSLKWRLKEANDQIVVEKEKAEANNGRSQSQVTADQHTITALNQDISDLETEKESLERKLELRNTAHDELSKELVQVQKSLAESKANLDKASKAKRTSEERETNEKRTSGRLQDELKAAQANIRAITRDKENQVAARKFDAEIKKDELRDATEAYDSLQFDVINLAVSCDFKVEDASSPEAVRSIVNDIKTSHLALTQDLAKKETSYSHAFDLASSLLKVLSPGENVDEINLDELLRLLTNKVGDIVTQAHKARQLPTISNDGDLIRLIGDLVVAGGGAETPTSLAELPKAIVDIKDALIAKNTVIVELQGRLHATESDLNEANLSHKTLELSLEQIQGELASSEQRYSSA